jgi:hypothetical protein
MCQVAGSARQAIIAFRIIQRTPRRRRWSRSRLSWAELSHKIEVEGLPLNMENRTEPRTVGQWIRYIVVSVIALFLVWWMLRLYVL